MTSTRYVLASLWQYRRVHCAVAAGVAIATAVITGALLVGDSVRGSLRDLAVERLGWIDKLLVAEQPFRESLAQEITSERTATLLLVPGSLSTSNGQSSRNATQLSILGHTDDFWRFQGSPLPVPLTGDQVAISRSIAAELGVAKGDEVLLRVPLLDGLPADSVLGEKSDTTTSRRLAVADVLPDRGLAKFSLRPSQQPPRNVFVPLATLQRLLDLREKANAIAFDEYPFQLEPQLEDYGVSVSEVTRPDSSDYFRITADRLVLPAALSEAASQAFQSGDLQPAVTYLANTIKHGDRQIPYSTITGVDSQAGIGPLFRDDGRPLTLADDEIVLNQWAANDLDAKIGDEVVIAYYQPETTHGILREATPVKLKLRAIASLTDAEGNRTAANDPKLTPDLPGVTDQRSINDWDLPFELVEPIRQQDEDYWDEYSTTPKAFVSYALAKKLWSTRWGTDSVLRIPAAAELTASEVEGRVQPDPQAMGMALLPVREQAAAASSGTTPFEGLFIGFSFFLVASAVMLIALLFRLGAESRAAELGILSAAGWNQSRLLRVWIAEAAIVAVLGGLVGVLFGIAYARLMIHGLSTWWVAATVTPFLKLHISTVSQLVGFAIGVAVALATIIWSLRKLTRIPARQLLTGDATLPTDRQARASAMLLLLLLFAIAATLGIFATKLEGEAQAGAFFGSGALVLTALLVWLRQRLHSAASSTPLSLSLTGLSARNARRFPSRTILSVALAAVASFLIIALSAFRLAPTEQGTGGFDLIATADLPLHYDLNTSDGRDELGFSSRRSEQLTDAKIFSFRVHAGEDASCLNLYQTTQPEIVGVPTSFFDEQKFGWAAHVGNQPHWNVLETDCGHDDNGRPVVPVVLDKNTAAYSLHLGGIGARMNVKDAYDRTVTLEIVGLLSNSVLQGKLLMSDANFVRLYPDSSGQQLFLIRQSLDIGSKSELTTLLETQLEDYGFDAVSTVDRLAGFLAVQNTYLSTFQSLGALGLMLGTFGLAIAQLRSVVQRRGELALLRSSGFRRSRLAEMVLGENAMLLLAGVGIGTLAALVAVLPHYFLQVASTPWLTLVGLLGAVIVAGLVSGWLAVRAAVKAPLLASLHGD
ncbi:MAG: FtsX-like permease family protein [Planctomycetota bacterium]